MSNHPRSDGHHLKPGTIAPTAPRLWLPALPSLTLSSSSASPDLSLLAHSLPTPFVLQFSLLFISPIHHFLTYTIYFILYLLRAGTLLTHLSFTLLKITLKCPRERWPGWFPVCTQQRDVRERTCCSLSASMSLQPTSLSPTSPSSGSVISFCSVGLMAVRGSETGWGSDAVLKRGQCSLLTFHSFIVFSTFSEDTGHASYDNTCHEAGYPLIYIGDRAAQDRLQWLNIFYFTFGGRAHTVWYTVRTHFI